MESEVNRRALYQRAYAIKKHHATRLHYDLRLEWNGVLLSWALPQGPSCRAGVLREAIETEDHRVANLLFEGVHETGPVMLRDRGTWEPHPEFEDIESCLRNGILRFTLYGERLKGGWMPARTNRKSATTCLDTLETSRFVRRNRHRPMPSESAAKQHQISEGHGRDRPRLDNTQEPTPAPNKTLRQNVSSSSLRHLSKSNHHTSIGKDQTLTNDIRF